MSTEAPTTCDCGVALVIHCGSHTCAWIRCPNPTCGWATWDIGRGVRVHKDGHSEALA